MITRAKSKTLRVLPFLACLICAFTAPAAFSATITGIYYLAFFAANNLLGTICGLLEKFPGTLCCLLIRGLGGDLALFFLCPDRSFGYCLPRAANETMW